MKSTGQFGPSGPKPISRCSHDYREVHRIYQAGLRSALWPRRGDLRVLYPIPFDYEEETRSIIGIRAMRQSWNPQPVEVEVRQNTFLDHEPFRRTQPILANAFHVRDVPYQWLRGSRLA